MRRNPALKSRETQPSGVHAMTGRAVEAALIVALVALIAWLVMGLPAARAHDPYTEWKVPGTTVSCCNRNDCRPTRARMTDAETWQAWDGARWVDIPPDRVLQFPSPDGRVHLCEANGTIYCFMPTGPKG
jgi:hypothetical protein